MSKGLDHNCGFDLACPLCDDTDLPFAQRLFGFFVVVDQNSFPNSPDAYSHRSRCCALVLSSCANCHCNEVALKLRRALVFFFVARACESARPLTCCI
jgi:hypothetical protein